ncbi:MAG TPA: undecaprenyldiphospho-muramoylpentapeptide beta-N-acetylglucosaminyltransferase [Candidatus Acidoferrales bacterium]|nr:undecaprenyldiphospho-muramoylpentapeptide beta-N-acetylglucosaminyltransferase [Candidatus Acidoferrales bacterium]
MRILLTGGGTGGHVYPALAIAEELQERQDAQPLSLLFVGTRDRLEAQIVPLSGIPIAFVSAAPLVRRISLALIKTVVLNAAGVVQALGILHRFRPDCVVATGGYVAFPVVLAMRIVRILGLSRGKIALLEPNAISGLTNRLLGPLVDEIWATYSEQHATHHGRAVLTGTPVRIGFNAPLERREARARLGLDPEKTTIVVMGGSQGARSLNDAVGLLVLPESWQVLHLTGRRDEVAPVRRSVVSIPYLDDPRAAYAAADIVVARSGASTLAELAVTGTPSILVPYPYATDAHQMHNAARFVTAGAARVITDRELDGVRLRRELDMVLEPQTLAEMRKAAAGVAPIDARERIARRVVALAAEK